jgi:hypothetical protein
LLLLRLGAALMLAGAGIYAIQSSLSDLLIIPLALAFILLLLGLGTRIVAFVSAAMAIGVGIALNDWRGIVLAPGALHLMSIGLLGAGAFSVDAHLFGRRVIRLDD